MSNHVAGRKMRLSKLFLLGLIALCMLFAVARAQEGGDEEVAVEAEGEAGAVAAGEEENAVDGEEEGGESQAAPQDAIKSQLHSSRPPTSVTGGMHKRPGKTGKIVKVAVLVTVIILVVLLIAGFGFIRPRRQVKANKEMFESRKSVLEGSKLFKFAEERRGDDKSLCYYVLPDETQTKAIGQADSVALATAIAKKAPKSATVAKDGKSVSFPTSDKGLLALKTELGLEDNIAKSANDVYLYLQKETLADGYMVKIKKGTLTIMPKADIIPDKTP